MFRRISLFCVLLLCAGGATAQVVPGDGWVTVAGGYGFGKTVVTGKTVDGGSISFSFDRLGPTRPLSLLFSFAYSTLTFDEQQTDQKVKRSVSSMPFYLGAKYWLGQGKVQGYAGAALGVYFSNLQTTVLGTEETFSTVQSTGWGLGVPLGLSAALTESVLLTGGLTVNWLWDNEFFENDLLYSANLGLAFKMGS